MEPMRGVPIPAFGVQGLANDQPEHTRSPKQLAKADNLRIQDGALTTIPALTVAGETSQTPVEAMAFYTLDDTGGHIIFYDDFTIVYYDSTLAELDITPTPAPTALTYSAVQINDLLFITNGTDRPWQITQTELQSGGTLTSMLNWPLSHRCRLLESYKGFCVAAGVTINGLEQRSMVKWSHPLSPGDAELFWDQTDATLLAGENVLAVAGRNIMALDSLRDNCMIYFDRSVWRMSFVGGGLVMDFAKVFDDDGAVGPHAVANYDGTAVVFGYNDIYAHDGFSKRSISDGKVTRQIYRNAKIDGTIRATYYAERREVFFLHRTNDSYTEPNVALIYAIDYDAFTTMEFPGANNMGGATLMYLGPKFNAVDVTYEDKAGPGGEYESHTGISYQSLRSTDENLDFYVLSSTAKQLLVMDNQTATAHDAGSVYARVERIDMTPLFGSTGDRIKYISRLFPQGTGSGTIQISVGVAMLPTGGIEWGPWVNFDLSTDWAADCRASGRYIGIQVRSAPGDQSMWSLSGFDFELMRPDAGRR